MSYKSSKKQSTHCSLRGEWSQGHLGHCGPLVCWQRSNLVGLHDPRVRHCAHVYWLRRRRYWAGYLRKTQITFRSLDINKHDYIFCITSDHGQARPSDLWVIDKHIFLEISVVTYIFIRHIIFDGESVGIFSLETLDHCGDAPTEPELQVLLEVRTEILTVQAVENLEWLSAGCDSRSSRRSLFFRYQTD